MHGFDMRIVVLGAGVTSDSMQIRICDMNK